MSALVLSTWNGVTHAVISFGPRKNVSEQIAVERARIPLTEAEAALSIDAVKLLYATQKLAFQSMRRAA